NAGNGGFLHCIQMDTSVNAANQVVSVGADIAFDADPKFFACLVRFESSSVPTTLPTAYDVYPLYGRHDGGYYTVKDCVTIDVLPRTPGNNVYVGFMVWSNFTATKCRGLRLVAFLLFLNPQCLASISRWITASSSWKRFCLFVCRALSSIMVICMLTAIRLLLTFVMSLYLLLRS